MVFVAQCRCRSAAQRSAIVILPDGRESARVPIAALNRLQMNASPPRRGAAGRILAELEGRDYIDDEDYERAMKLLALLRPDKTRKRDVTRKTVRLRGGPPCPGPDDFRVSHHLKWAFRLCPRF